MPRPSKHLPREHDGSTRKSRLKSRLARLRRERFHIEREIKKLERLWDSVRPFHKCKRCGYEWRGMNPENTPRNCARCHSAGWNSEVKNPRRARRPQDAANPNWAKTSRAPRKKSGASDGFRYDRITPVIPEPVISPERVGDIVIPMAPRILEELERLDTAALIQRALELPAGLPPPPNTIRMGPLHPPPFSYETQAPPAPVLYHSRAPEPEPQPETISSNGHTTVTREDEGSGIGRTEPEPPAMPEPPDELELMFPPVSLDLHRAAELGEDAWEDYVESEATEAEATEAND